MFDCDGSFLSPEEIADRLEFADPGGRSALRAGKRNKPCPTCGTENALTAADVRRGYQCNRCADAAEGISFYGEY